MNGPHTPVFSRRNRWTDLIERVATQNAQDGKPAGRMIEQMGNATPVISAVRVRHMSPAEARRTDFVPEPEDPRAAMMANARAAALGITNDGSDNDDMPGDIGHVSGELTDAELDQMMAAARGQAPPGAQTAAEGAAARGPAPGAPAAGSVSLPRGQAAPAVGLSGPRSMPNFANVEGFDLTRKVVVVDGMEFKIADDDVTAMKKFAIQVVLDNVTFQLAQALVQLGIPQEMAKATAEKMRETASGATESANVGTAGGAAAQEAMQEVRPGETNDGVPKEARGLQAVSEPTGRGAVEAGPAAPGVHEGSRTEVPPDDEGSRETLEGSERTDWSSYDTAMLLGDGGITPS